MITAVKRLYSRKTWPYVKPYSINLSKHAIPANNINITISKLTRIVVDVLPRMYPRFQGQNRSGPEYLHIIYVLFYRKFPKSPGGKNKGYVILLFCHSFCHSFNLQYIIATNRDGLVKSRRSRLLLISLFTSHSSLLDQGLTPHFPNDSFTRW